MIEGVTQVPFDLRWKGLNVWRDYVVGFFLEQRLPYPVVKEALKKKWRTKGDCEMVADTELFYFKFSNEEDKRKVLENSPIYIAGKCFIVTQWTQDIEKRKSTVKAIPIWKQYNEIGEVNIGNIDASIIPRRAKAVNAEGVDRTEGNPNEVSMADLCLSAIAVESEGVLRRTDETSMVAENEEGIVATEESTPLVKGFEVGVNETSMVLDRIKGSELAVVLATVEVTEVATGNAQDYDSESDTEMSQSNMFATLLPYVEGHDIVVALLQELPHLSHLGVRARQQRGVSCSFRKWNFIWIKTPITQSSS
ncbi:hypothetical protein IFM89_009635 [Coptis chinensis]|uniref:DUF4283 domain-containing protein n=1 Tax=Coptis chinensis TaxID=261450 RepID=A0A835M270_9MAGN|nr:hypothetical protein IFM89_009635 [Coptis chinensis]